MFVQYGHETELERQAGAKRREIEQLLKEISEWQAIIVLNLGIMVRGGATKANLKQIEDASREYGDRLSTIMEYCSAYRLPPPKAANRHG